ncbi:hypothetical protein M409DRAFT_22742 [Zasmidium cellare ATCC 36951]|uniref:Aminoglycoside phosphotransferase domain-containing protein n=1 Tax=Zasmidium cellare ATCC 36951 TaxID=1080233 RepID=A0A6A6CJI4_ZASCE|nr:uncharacterized protein M409DRAFT_22742 [Zasmidium cellare ATCC 36951]KAF2167315.1 hypothetical protein M409DRAFT_22742 [Zasmidium cellare ATCC 36951]
MEATYDEISEAEMSKKMRKRLKKTFNEALDAHHGALKSQSAIAKYNSGILRDLEAAFIASPNVDLLSRIPPSYSSSMAELLKENLDGQDPLESELPPSKRLKVHDCNETEETVEDIPKHLRTLHGPGEAVVKAPLAVTIERSFGDDLSASNIISALSRSQIVFRDTTGGERMILKISDESVVKIVPDSTDTREYDALIYLSQKCPEVPAPRPEGLIQLNGQSLMFMSYIPGESLAEVWDSMSQGQKATVSGELNTVFSELRSHQCPPSIPWGAIDGAGCIDQRRTVRRSDRDILSAKDFEEFFFSNPKYGSEVWIAFLRKLYDSAEGEQDSQDTCVFTHGDLRQANVLVRRTLEGELSVSGIIDWEFSGFYPAYWESIKLTNCMGTRETSDWFLHLPESISPLRYPKRWLLNLVWDSHVD